MGLLAFTQRYAMNDVSDNKMILQGLVKGRVQGVFFRAETQAEAIRLGLSGWVRNTIDGHVEVLIAGDSEMVEQMRSWLLQGPPRARVDALELDELSAQELAGRDDELHRFTQGEFEIRR